MATDTTNPNSQSGEAPNSQPEANAAAENKRGVKKKPELPPELDSLMKELAGDTSSGGASTIGRLERRVNVLEAAFADIVQRHESSLRDRSAQLAAVEQNVSALRNRIDEAHKVHSGATAELRNAIGEVRVRLNGLEAPRQQAQVFVPPPPVAEIPAFESVAPVPTVEPEETAAVVQEPQEVPAADLEAPVAEDRGSQGPDWLSAARRAANASVRDSDMIARAAPEAPQAPRRGGRARMLLVGCAAPLLVLAGAAFFVNRHPVTAQPKAPPAVARAAATKPANVAPVKQAQNTPPPDVAVTAPEDPTSSEIVSTAAADELQEKAGQGNAGAARDLGLKYLTGDGVEANDDEAVRWLLRAAYNGEPNAEYWLGTLYARGRGLPEDESQALHWYEAAAKQGNAKAMHRLGVAYFEGQGVEKNDTEAARWFTEAAEEGNSDAAFNLAVLYERGAGVNPSLVEAYKWYAVAAHAGDKQSALRVEVLSKQLKPAELSAATHATAEFKPKTSSVASSK
jgi:localization factor PodJL